MTAPDYWMPTEITRRWRTAIPLLDAMGFQVDSWQHHRLTTHAPLPPNRNDKQTGFAGSIAALANVTGWGLITLLCDAQGHQVEVVIRDSQLAYRQPLTADLVAQAEVSAEQAEGFLVALQQRGKARLALTVTVGTAANPACAQLDATYVAWTTGAPEKTGPTTSREAPT